MYWKQLFASGELNGLINKCSTFVLFDFIRKCGRQTNDGREATTEKLWRLQNRLRLQKQQRTIEARATVVAQSSKQQVHYSTLLKVWKSEMIVTIKCETGEAKCQCYSKWIKSASNNSVNKVPYWYIHREHKQSRKSWDKWCVTKYK